MLLVKKLFLLQVLVLCLTYVNGMCQYAHHLNNPKLIEKITKSYMCAISYDTYKTYCHHFVEQPPTIPNYNIQHSLENAVNATRRYAALDVETSGGIIPPTALTDMDRINWFFESSTRYIQETRCASKKTTTIFLPTVSLGNLTNYLTPNWTTVMCDNGHPRYPDCSNKQAVRQFDGTCNNLDKPLDGSVGDCMQRLLPADYKDAINDLRTSIDGTPLTNVKVLSDSLFGGAESRPLSKRYTQFQAFFGEFVILDNGMTLNHATGLGVNLQCCDDRNHTRVDHPQCAPFFVPPEACVSHTYVKDRCTQFARSLPCTRCNLGPRMISSSVPAAQDLNSVYGVSDEMAKNRRLKIAGKLKSEHIHHEEIFATEKVNGTSRQRCLWKHKCDNPSPLDGRNLYSPFGLVIALLFHRNHNYHAKKIFHKKPKWSDDRVFQEARRWNIAEYQHLVYGSYLETLIGKKLMDHYALYPLPCGQYSYYEEDISARTVMEFQTTAARQGHRQIVDNISFINKTTLEEYELSIHDDSVFETIFHNGIVDGLLLAQMYKPTFEPTPSIPNDIAAFDIQRQRDHGMAGYIYYLNLFHDLGVDDWDKLSEFIDLESFEKLKEHYKYVEDIELYVGGLHERIVSDAIVGSTFAHIAGIQFHNSKYGDRFFYEHKDQAGSFTIEQLDEIKTKTCFARLLCKNSHLEYVLKNPLKLHAHDNEFVLCSDFDDFDYHFPREHKIKL